jgi:hypothetical protein
VPVLREVASSPNQSSAHLAVSGWPAGASHGFDIALGGTVMMMGSCDEASQEGTAAVVDGTAHGC